MKIKINYFKILIIVIILIPIGIATFYMLNSKSDFDVIENIEKCDRIYIKSFSLMNTNDSFYRVIEENFYITSDDTILAIKKLLSEAIQESAYPVKDNYDVFILADLMEQDEFILQVKIIKNYDSDITHIRIYRPFYSVLFHSYDENAVNKIVSLIENEL